MKIPAKQTTSDLKFFPITPFGYGQLRADDGRFASMSSMISYYTNTTENLKRKCTQGGFYDKRVFDNNAMLIELIVEVMD